METILLLSHTQSDGTLPNVALEALGAATELCDKLDGAKLVIGLVGENIQAAADSIADTPAQSIYGVEGAEFAQSRYASDAAAAEAIANVAKASIVLAPATSRFSRTIPGVSARLDGRVDSRVSGLDVVDSQIQVQRWYYRQRILASLTRESRPWFLLIESGVFTAWSGQGGSASIELVPVNLGDDCTRTKVEGFESPGAKTQTIRPDAEVLFVAGAGWTKKQADGEIHGAEAEKLILGFTEMLGASLGSSKSLVDQGSEGQQVLGCLSHLNQIGQTGASPRHAKGLSTCCHGEEPHVVGWRFINERRAINKDPNCGWALGKTDVLYVADAFEVMAKVNELLK